MRKAIFLEYKFGDYDTNSLHASGANEAIAWMEKLNPTRIKQLKEWGVKVSLSFSGFDDSICPLNPKSNSRLRNLINQAIMIHPSGVIIDHFRFSGHWENQKRILENIHGVCPYCQGKDRGQELAKIAKSVRKSIPKSIEVGYYAVPAKYTDITVLGQNHELLGQIFDYISPMTYQRMLNRQVKYISEFTQYLFSLSHKLVIPIIQVKDMPDKLNDGVNEEVLSQEYEEAIKPPSAGVAWFSWDGAIEKNKAEIISKLFACT